jgi:WD40 repeat protein/serine/threonine protein kinase
MDRPHWRGNVPDGIDSSIAQPPSSPGGAPGPGESDPGATDPLHAPPALPGWTAGDAERDTAPPVVPGYEILGELGSGGMGAVYRARQLSLNREVAIKLLKRRYASDPLAAHRFLDEARITGLLEHPAIPPVHDIGTLPDGRPFLAMKLIKGSSLADLLAGATPRAGGPPARFVAVFAQVCQAVAYAHSRGVIHRDLKPANVMVGSFGEVQLMDWGLAREARGAEPEPCGADTAAGVDAPAPLAEVRTPQSHLTHAGSVVGTPAFMAPEQARGALAAIDERSDVFGLGAVLCAILTGEPPYVGPSTQAVRQLAIRGATEAAFVRLDRSGGDPELVALCKRCLAADPAARPRDARQVADAVAAHLAAADERARRAELARVRSEERRKRRLDRVMLAWAVSLILALAGFGVGLARLWRDTAGARDQLQQSNNLLGEEKKLTEAARDEALRQKGLADAARDQALRLRAQADSARAEEAGLRLVADAARDEALRQKGIAERAGAAEAAVRKRLEGADYGHTMQVAYQEWRDNNIPAGRALLDGTRPHLRGWEFRHVHRLCNAWLLTLRGHTDQVYSAALSRDGARAVTAGRDGTARVWDAKTGAELLVLRGQKRMSAAAFSPDGVRVVTANWDGTARAWDAKTGEPLVEFKGHASPVLWVAYSLDGSRVVTAAGNPELPFVGSDNTARVWDAATGKQLAAFAGHEDIVTSAAFSADRSRVVTSSQDRTARVWDASTGRELLTLRGHAGVVASAAFSADDSRIVTASSDRTARVWDAKTGRPLLALTGHDDWVTSAHFSTDGARVVTASWDTTARLWDAKTGAELFALKGHADRVASAAFSADGSRVITASWDRTARLWDAVAGAQGPILRGFRGFVYSVSVSADGSRAAAGCRDGSVRVWDAVARRDVFTLAKDAGPVLCTAFTPDRARVAAGSFSEKGKGTLTLWDAKTGKELLAFQAHASLITAVSFNPDGSRLVTASADATAKVWDTSGVGAPGGTAKLVFTLRGHDGALYAAAFAPAGRPLVATGGADGTAKLWDAKTGKELRTLRGHAGAVNAAAFSADGSKVVTGSEDATAKVWDATTGEELLALRGHTDRVTSAAFIPDGSRVVTGSHDRTAKLWDARTGVEVLTLRGHSDGVTSVAFGDEARIVTGSFDRTVRVWDARPLNRDPKEPAPDPRPVDR